MCTIAPDQIIDLVSAVKARHQGIELKMADVNAWELEERLLQGDLEVAIYCIPANSPTSGFTFSRCFGNKSW